jgi:hypothetical protein
VSSASGDVERTRGGSDPMLSVASPMNLPGEEVVEEDELLELDAPAEPEEQERFEEELERIASAERQAASDVNLIRLFQ